MFYKDIRSPCPAIITRGLPRCTPLTTSKFRSLRSRSFGYSGRGRRFQPFLFNVNSVFNLERITQSGGVSLNELRCYRSTDRAGSVVCRRGRIANNSALGGCGGERAFVPPIPAGLAKDLGFVWLAAHVLMPCFQELSAGNRAGLVFIHAHIHVLHTSHKFLL